MNARAALSIVCGCMLGMAATVFAAEEGTAPPATNPGWVRQIKGLADKAPDCSSLEAIVRTATRGFTTNDEKTSAIYNAGRRLRYHRAYPGEKGGICALKMTNVYGWSLCGGQHTVLAALRRAAGWGWGSIGWRGQTTVECRYDGAWHHFDTFLKCYTRRPEPGAPGGRTVASQADIRANPGLITDRFVLDQARRVWYFEDNRFEIFDDTANGVAPAFFVCGDTPEGVVQVIPNRATDDGWTVRIDITRREPTYLEVDVQAGAQEPLRK
jgi:hypothetical protein